MSNTPFSQALAIIPAAAPTYVTGNAAKPWPGMKCTAISSGAAVVYGVNKQAAKAGSSTWGRVIGNGSTLSWTNAAIPCLSNANVVADAALNAANTLRVVVTVDGVPLIREGSDDGSLGASDFKVSSSGSTYTLTLGAAPSDGAVVDVHIASAAQINTATVLADTVPAQQEVYDFMGTATATAVLFAD